MEVKFLENNITHGLVIAQILEETKDHYKVMNPCMIQVDLDPESQQYRVNFPYILFHSLLKDYKKGDVKLLPKYAYGESLNEFDADIVKGYKDLEERRNNVPTGDKQDEGGEPSNIITNNFR